MEPENEKPTAPTADEAPAAAPAPATEPPAGTTGVPGPGVPRWVFAALVVLVLAALFWPRGERISLERKPQPVDAAGARVELASRFGRVTLLHFWATWCAPCVTEIPALRRLARDMPHGAGLSYALVSFSDDPAKAQAFLGELAGLALFDGDWNVARSYGTDKLPETYLLVDGKVVEKFVGATDWDDPTLRARLRGLAATPER